MKSSIASLKAARSRCAKHTLAITLCVSILAVAEPATAASADLTQAINALRARGCAGSSGTPNELRQTRALDAVAEAWSRGGRLKEALQRQQYRATNSSSMRVAGTTDDRKIIDVLASNYCKLVTEPEFTEIGIERRGREVWMVVAAPLNFPTVKDTKSVEREVLERVNAARAKSRKCGNTSMPPAPPLQLSALLNRAALIHAQDMAKHDHFEHEGTDGSTPADRASRVGYRWKNVGENIAAGAPTAAAVVDGWLKSPGHCVNIMGLQYKEMGIAFTLAPKSEAGIYWAQEFATHR